MRGGGLRVIYDLSAQLLAYSHFHLINNFNNGQLTMNGKLLPIKGNVKPKRMKSFKQNKKQKIKFKFKKKNHTQRKRATMQNNLKRSIGIKVMT